MCRQGAAIFLCHPGVSRIFLCGGNEVLKTKCAKVGVRSSDQYKETDELMKIAVLALQLTCNGKIVLHKYLSRLAASRMGRVMPSRVQKHTLLSMFFF
jgi:hypothetical protein